MATTRTFCAAALIALLLAPAKAMAQAPWPVFQRDLQHTGRSTLQGPEANPIAKWTFATPTTPNTPSVGADGTIYLAAGDYPPGGDAGSGTLFAINPDGSQKWAFPLTGPPGSTPAIGGDGVIYVHANGAENIAGAASLTAVNPNGTQKWRFEFGTTFSAGSISNPAVATDGKIWVGSQNTLLYRLNPEDGSIACSVSPSASSIPSSPAFAPDGSVYIVDTSTTLFAFNNDCSPKWEYQLSDAPTATANDQSPAVAADQTVWVGSPVGDHLYAINPNGTLRCRFQTGDSFRSTPAFGADGTVYAGTDGLYAVNPSNCSQKWHFRPFGALFSSASPLVDADGTIYWRDTFNAYAVNPDGSQKWESMDVRPPASTQLEPSGVITEAGTLYLADGGGLESPTRLRALITGATPALGGPDTSTRLKLSAKRSQRVLKQGGVVVVVECPDEDCTARATGSVSVPTAASAAAAARRFKLKRARRSLDPARRTRLKLGLSNKLRKAIKGAFRDPSRRGRVRARVKVKVRDFAGNERTKTVRVKLVR